MGKIQFLCFSRFLLVLELEMKGAWDKLKAKTMFPDTITHKVLETDSSFYVK